MALKNCNVFIIENESVKQEDETDRNEIINKNTVDEILLSENSENGEFYNLECLTTNTTDDQTTYENDFEFHSINTGVQHPENEQRSFYKWSEEESKYMLFLYSQYRNNIGFKKQFRIKKLMWAHLANCISKKFDVVVNGTQVESRYKCVMRRARQIVDYDKESLQTKHEIKSNVKTDKSLGTDPNENQKTKSTPKPTINTQSRQLRRKTVQETFEPSSPEASRSDSITPEPTTENPVISDFANSKTSLSPSCQCEREKIKDKLERIKKKEEMKNKRHKEKLEYKAKLHAVKEENKRRRHEEKITLIRDLIRKKDLN